MKITDLKYAIIGNNHVIRITTDEGIDGYGQAEASKDYLKPHIMFYREYLLDQDPTDVERVMKRIRRLGAFKPWGSSVSAIEFALWDIAGKAAGVPVYKLLGGKVRDRVQVYNGNVRFPLEGFEPEHYADNVRNMKASFENFSIIKQGVSFHGPMATGVPGFYYGDADRTSRHPNSGLMTEKGFNHLMACIEAMKEVCGEDVGLALDAGPGMTPQGPASRC
jgi:L-alanine-DL-glutamate epimerase-like enolase superfamily enzyme